MADFFLQYDPEQAGGSFEPITPQEYEVVISEVKKDKSQSGNDMLKLTLTIREDYDQEFKKRKVWDYLVATEKAKFKFHQVAKALGAEKGQTFATLEEFAKFIAHKPVRVKIDVEEQEYNGEIKIQNRVKAYMPSEKPIIQRQNDDPFSIPQDALTISDDDLPF